MSVNEVHRKLDGVKYSIVELDRELRRLQKIEAAATALIRAKTPDEADKKFHELGVALSKDA